MNEKVLVDDLTRFGLRRVHLLGMKRVDRAAAVELAPVEAMDVQMLEWREEGVGMWHTWLVWKAREVIQLSTNGANSKQEVSGANGGKEIKGNGEEVLMWWVGEGETVGGVIEEAAGRFRMEMGREPGRLLARKVTKTGVTLEGGGVVVVEEAGWVPVGFFVLV